MPPSVRQDEGASRAAIAARMLAKPSTEIQADAIAAQVLAAAGGAAGTLAMAASGVDPDVYVPFAGLALGATGLAAWEALRKLRFERHYGRFFMASPAIASDDLADDAGVLLARRGIDEVLELHLVSDLPGMRRLARQGLAGRLRIMLDGLGGLRALSEEMDDPQLARVTVVTARPHLVNLLDRLGFVEISNPPRRDAANRVLHRVSSARVALMLGGDPFGHDESRMSYIAREDFASEAFREAVDAQIARVTRGLERLEARRAAEPRDDAPA